MRAAVLEGRATIGRGVSTAPHKKPDSFGVFERLYHGESFKEPNHVRTQPRGAADSGPAPHKTRSSGTA